MSTEAPLTKPVRHLLKISDITAEELLGMIETGIDMKKHQEKYTSTLANKTLLAFFSKPSLRTRVSLETAMTKLGGHTIYYELGAKSNIGGKETVCDTANCASRMVDIIAARLPTRAMMAELAEHSRVTCLNTLDDFGHPCQMVADAITIRECLGCFKGLKFLYSGDCMNNVTYDLMRMWAMLGVECRIACPEHKDFMPIQEVLDEVAALNKVSGGCFKMYHNLAEAAKGVDVIYCDSWMSYHISKEEHETRYKILLPYQVNAETMKLASERCIFMNCLPATRGEEQTAEVIDGPRSVVYQEAGNRLWSAMAILDFYINKN